MELGGATANGSIGLSEDPPKKPSANPESGPASAGGFDCNICLDIAADPVVSLCGHLYCWPCIYKWLELETPSSAQNCPVCKAPLPQSSLVPLYGRGCPPKTADRVADLPSRPRVAAQQTDDRGSADAVLRHRHHHHYHVHHHYPYDNSNAGSSSSSSNEFVSAPSSPLGGNGGRVIGGMAIAVLPWMLGDRREAASLPLLQSRQAAGSGRMRRQEKEVQRSLHQIWLFLSCCALLCLFLF